jgi:hypothetical protein
MNIVKEQLGTGGAPAVPCRFVVYFMSRIEMLRSAGVEPVVVFDGGPMASKADEEDTRRRWG